MYQKPHAPSPHALAKPYALLRLPMTVDALALAEEIGAAPLNWLPSQWKWHLGTYFCILRAGAEGRHPGSALINGTGVDTADLRRLPRIRHFLDTAFPVPAALAWIGLSPANSRIHTHIDNTAHWDEHHRIHVPLVTTPAARLCIGSRFQHFPLGTVWALNNSVPHGAINAGPDRLHLVLDLPSTPEVEDLLARAEPVKGELDPVALAQLAGDPLAVLTEAQRADAYLMARLQLQ
jgi:kumamolisin